MAKRKTMHKSQRIHLVDLPPAALRYIFLGVSEADEGFTFDQLVLCKPLLPYTLAGLACIVKLGSPSSLVRFVAATRANPDMLDLVRTLMFQEDDWLGDLEPGGGGQICRGGKGKKGVYEPASIIPGQQLLLDLVTSLSKLYSMALFGKGAIDLLLSQDFLSTKPFANLGSLVLAISPLDAEQTWNETTDRNFLLRLVSIPTLRELACTHAKIWDLPVPLLETAPSSYLTPRSWLLDNLAITHDLHVSPLLRQIFASCSCLTMAKLELESTYPTFFADLIYLPSTLLQLFLKVGPLIPQ
ncbi:hypothetical protein JCM8547_006452 [Rhodosporidiobolus lusitaniae]